MLLIETIEEDSQVPDLEDGSSEDEEEIEEAPVKKAKKPAKVKVKALPKSKKKQSEFAADFAWEDADYVAPVTNSISETVKAMSKGKSRLNENVNEKLSVMANDVVFTDSENEEEQAFESAAGANPEEGVSELKNEEEKAAEETAEEKRKFFTEAPPQEFDKKFSDMNLSRPILKGVSSQGFMHPTPIQASAIPLGLLGKDICACAVTGSGKTAAYVLPILERILFKPKSGSFTRVLIIVPTRELGIQVSSVVSSLSAFMSSVTMCMAVGGMDIKSQEANIRQGPDIIVATPGRLIDLLYNTPTFDLSTIEILVIDEADRCLDENFKDQLNEIVKSCSPGRQTMLFSATMTDEVKELASLSLNSPVRLFINKNTEVASGLTQEFVRIRTLQENSRIPIICALCCRSFNENVMIFVPTKKLAHELRIVLSLLKLNVDELHGNLTMAQRVDALAKFKEGKTDILVSTDLASRGLDIEGVKTVINYSLPTTVKRYVHRVGRTARAGKLGRSITLAGETERKIMKEVVKSSTGPVKNRIIPQNILLKYVQRCEQLKPTILSFMKTEEEDKLMRITNMEVNKAKNMLEHEEEIFSRPARQFMKTDEKKKVVKKRKPKKLDGEEFEIKKGMSFARRESKREMRPKRMAKMVDDDGKKKKVGVKRKAGFSEEAKGTTGKTKKKKEMTTADTSKPKEKKMNRSGKPGVGKFKSKGKYKRRK